MALSSPLPYDLILESDDETTPTTSLPLMLALDPETGRKLWAEGRLEPFPPRQSEGAVEYAHKDPRYDLVWSKRDWSGGALQALQERDVNNHYAQADGLDARWPNMLAMGMSRSTGKLGFLVANADFETNSITGWTHTSAATVSITNSTVAAHGGSRHLRAVPTSGTWSSGDWVYYTLTNPTVYQSREITFYAYIKDSVGVANSLRLRVEDSVGASTSSAHAATTSYELLSVTRTIDAAATYVRVGVENLTIGGTKTIDVDDIFIVPTGGIVAAGLATIGSDGSDSPYVIMGRMVGRIDITNNVIDAVYLHASAVATSIVSFNDTIYVAYGGGDNAYIYGATTSWTVSTLTGDAKYAHFFAISRSTLWKTRKDGGGMHCYVASATDATNTGAWSAEYKVGALQPVITGLYSYGDSILVGKSDGLFTYIRVYADGASADVFANITIEYAASPSNTNFDKGVVHQGWLYLTAGRQSLVRYNGVFYENLSALLQSPRLADFGGSVRAMAAEQVQLFLLVDTPTTDTTPSKTTRLMSLREVEGRLQLHTLHTVSIGSIERLEVWSTYLLAMGRSYNSDASAYESAVYYWTLPTKTPAPAQDSSPSIATSGTLEEPAIDFLMPDETKAFEYITFFLKDVIDAEHTLKVEFKIDEEAAWVTLGTLSTASQGTIQTLSFNDLGTGSSRPEISNNAYGRAIKLRYTLITDDTVSIIIYAVAFHATLRPRIRRTVTVYMQVGSEVPLNTGLGEPLGRATLLSRLSTLESQEYPLVCKEDFDGQGSYATFRAHIEAGSLRRERGLEQFGGSEIYSFKLIEVLTS